MEILLSGITMLCDVSTSCDDETYLLNEAAGGVRHDPMKQFTYCFFVDKLRVIFTLWSF